MQKAIVVGAGIAGLATALRLKAKGYLVEVFEANEYPGGKLHVVEQKGYRFDAGPSLFTMPHLVDELFTLFGEDPKDHFTYKRKADVCHYFWEDGTRFDAKADEATFIQEAAAIFQEDPKVIARFMAHNQEKYAITHHVFLEKSLHKASTYFNWQTAKSMLQLQKLDLTTTLHAVNQRNFQHPKLVQLFDRFATYNGSSPYKTPGVMSLIPHLEMHFGTFFPEGGMHSITQALFALAKRQGVQFHFGQKVDSILHDGKKVQGIKIGDEATLANVVVSNMDIWSTYRHLLADVPQPERILKQERSSSAFIFYWGIKQQFPELDLHNILFTEDYHAEFKALFDDKALYHDPTVYINISSKDAQQDAPAGCENWFVMINTPGNVGQDWEALKHKTKQHILAKIQRCLGVDVAPLIETEEVLNPVLIERKTSSHQGSLYGAASNSTFSAFLRHKNFSNRLRNLYFVGGSVHPGGGIPLCLQSAKIVGDMVSMKSRWAF